MSGPRQRLRKGAARRAAQVANLHRLTDSGAAALLDSSVSKTVNEEVVWTAGGARSGEGSEVRMRVSVFNSMNEPLFVTGRIELDNPLASHWLLVWGTKRGGQHSVNLRRLDLRDSHPNPDGQRWDHATHKHTWSEADGNAWAYTPTDIPHDQSPSFVGHDDYRLICEAFLAECGIELGPDYKWSEPPLDAGTPTLWSPP
jgi:hypothetical protein